MPLRLRRIVDFPFYVYARPNEEQAVVLSKLSSESIIYPLQSVQRAVLIGCNCVRWALRVTELPFVLTERD
jgi:hypothetical protein